MRSSWWRLIKNDPGRFLVLEFLFRAHQRLIALDDDAEHRKALLEICRELVKAPDDLAELRLEADLLLNQAELAKQGANAEDAGESPAAPRRALHGHPGRSQGAADGHAHRP